MNENRRVDSLVMAVPLLFFTQRQGTTQVRAAEEKLLVSRQPAETVTTKSSLDIGNIVYLVLSVHRT